jgi:CheY-like chemotaxis protein
MQANQIRLLITDDIEDNRLVLKTICKKLGDIEIFEAQNGLEATQIVEKEDIDIVLMDVMMPVMDGFEATKIIKNSETPPYLMIITAVADKETEDKFTKLGIDGYVRKPIDKEALKARLEALKNSCLIKKGIRSGMSAKKPLSKQALQCRNFKTYFYVENEEDAMNLGLWLTDHKAKLDTNVTFLFEDSLALIYKICKLCIKKLSSLTIVIEEDFENIYLTFIPSNSIECMELADKLSNEIKQNLLCETTLIYLTVKINNDIKISFAEPFKLQEQKGRDKLNLSEDDVRMLRRSHTDKISAAEFVREYAESGSMDEIHDLRDIEDKWRELVGEIGVIKNKRFRKCASRSGYRGVCKSC